MPDVAQDRDPLHVFSVDPTAETPPFRQMHDAVVQALADGRLLPGQKLPTIRALAGHVDVAVNTVAAAYRSLEGAGVIEGRGRAGTFVSLDEDPVGAAARRIALDAAEQMRDLGVGPGRSREMFAEAVAALRPPQRAA